MLKTTGGSRSRSAIINYIYKQPQTKTKQQTSTIRHVNLCMYIESVSYTHLDVYKRQVVYSTNYMLSYGIV